MKEHQNVRGGFILRKISGTSTQKPGSLNQCSTSRVWLVVKTAYMPLFFGGLFGLVLFV